MIMTKQELIQHASNVMALERCAPELKDAVKGWLDAVGTAEEHAAAEVLAAELKDDVMTLDMVIEHMGYPDVIARLGERAAVIAENAKAAKAEGKVWCTCPACQTALPLLLNVDDLLA